MNTDILTVAADGLICSANPSLNLSGGVGGAFLLRYGSEMQVFLHDHLRRTGLRFIEPGNAIVAPSCGSPFIAVSHAVAIDAFYDTNADLIRQAYEVSLNQLAGANCRTIVAACLGCGYGRCSIPEFVKTIQELIELPFPDINIVTLATTNLELADAIATITGVARTSLGMPG